MKTAVIIINIVFLLFIAYLFFPNNPPKSSIHNEIIKDIPSNQVLYRERKIGAIDELLFYKGEIVISNTNGLFSYSLSNRELKNLDAILPTDDFILGEYNDEIVLCSWKNLTKKKHEDIGTNLVILNLSGEAIFNLEIIPTVKPVSCLTKQMDLENAYSFLQEKHYKYNLENQKIEEVRKQYEKYSISGSDTILISNKVKLLYKIPKANDIKQFWVSEQLNTVVLLSHNGNIWIYTNELVGTNNMP